ncbi:MAG: spore coat associated protein CotJA [Clostridia bacterium]|nr:spore coat associated protein CotJA [Clostridia bacterium]
MTECSCPGHFGVVDGVLAALYLPVQEFDDIYDEETALQRGTLFRALDLPFRGGKGGK